MPGMYRQVGNACHQLTVLQEDGTGGGGTGKPNGKGKKSREAGGTVRKFMPTEDGTGDPQRVWLATVEDNETYNTVHALDMIDM